MENSLFTQLEVDNYLTVYKEANIKKINFMNLQEVLVSNLYNEQTEIINTLVKSKLYLSIL